MEENRYFQPGETAVLRQLFLGKIWEARPAIVVRDTPELIAFFSPPGSIWKESHEDLRPAQRIHSSWSLVDKKWSFGGILRLTLPGADYSVLLLKNTDGSLYRWYINLEEPLNRTVMGFDYIDLILDVMIEPDLSAWSWKDENELEDAVSAGLISKEQATGLYIKGEAVVAFLKSGKSTFNGWENWYPDPLWTIPVLPDGWDKA